VTRWVFPFSHAWHDDADLDGHVPMPLNAAGQGPECDPDRVVVTICWCWRGVDCPVLPPVWAPGQDGGMRTVPPFQSSDDENAGYRAFDYYRFQVMNGAIGYKWRDLAEWEQRQWAERAAGRLPWPHEPGQ
jgi:hypothetical protein